MKKGNDDHNEKRSRTIFEYDFFDERRIGPSNRHVVPPLRAPLKEIIFPQILYSTHNIPSSSSTRKRKTYVDDDEQSAQQDCNNLALILHPSVGEEMQPRLLFVKKLTASDVGKNLVITGGETLMAALTEEERERVEREEGYVEVMARDPVGKEYRMRVSKWHDMMGMRRAMIIHHRWLDLVCNPSNDLKKDDTIQGWGYRGDDGLLRLDFEIIKMNKLELSMAIN